MSFFDSEREHWFTRGIDAAGNYFSKLLPCHSHTCYRTECQARAVQRLEQALRFAIRNQDALMVTWSKLPDSAAAKVFHDKLVDALRGAGFATQAFSVVEHHAQGLVHVHTILKTAADLAEIQAAFESVRPSLPQTRWSSFDFDGHALVEDAGYSLKNYADGNRERHLFLNGGKLYLTATKQFFRAHGVSSIKDCWKAEKARGRAYYRLVGVIG